MPKTETPLDKMLKKKLEKIKDKKRKDVRFKSNQQCRYFDVVVDEKRRALHLELIMEFSVRGIWSPPGGSAGPHFRDGILVKGYYRFIFMLDETVADEYIERMKKS